MSWLKTRVLFYLSALAWAGMFYLWMQGEFLPLPPADAPPQGMWESLFRGSPLGRAAFFVALSLSLLSVISLFLSTFHREGKPWQSR